MELSSPTCSSLASLPPRTSFQPRMPENNQQLQSVSDRERFLVPEVLVRELAVWYLGNFEPADKSQAHRPAGLDADFQRQSQGCNSYNWKDLKRKRGEGWQHALQHLCPHSEFSSVTSMGKAWVLNPYRRGDSACLMKQSLFSTTDLYYGYPKEVLGEYNWGL